LLEGGEAGCAETLGDPDGELDGSADGSGERPEAVGALIKIGDLLDFIIGPRHGSIKARYGSIDDETKRQSIHVSKQLSKQVSYRGMEASKPGMEASKRGIEAFWYRS